MLEYLRIGRITNSHGLRGEVKVVPTSMDVARFDEVRRAFIDLDERLIEVEVASVKYLNKFVVLKFRGYDNIDDILKFKGSDLLVKREDAIELEEGEYFIGDLIGCEVYDDKKIYGRLKDVLLTGANDVYVVELAEGGELLIPVIEDCILDIDIVAKKIRVKLLKGL